MTIALSLTPAAWMGRGTRCIGCLAAISSLGSFGSVVPRRAIDEDELRLRGALTGIAAVDPIRAKFAYVFTEDGKLHQLDILKGEVTNSLTLTEPYSMDGHWNDPRPRIAVAGDNIVVTDSLNGVLRLVSAASFTMVGEIAVEGMPYNIVAVGGSGQTHESEGTEAHNHGDDQIYKGYSEVSQVEDRALSDWAGDWQSVYLPSRRDA